MNHRDVINMVAADAEVERKIVLRVLDAYNRLKHLPWRERLERQGRRWGRPSTVGADLLKRATAMRRDGMSVHRIAAELKVTRSTLSRAMKSQSTKE